MAAVVQYEIRLARLFQSKSMLGSDYFHRLGMGVETYQYSIASDCHMFLEIDDIDLLRQNGQC